MYLFLSNSEMITGTVDIFRDRIRLKLGLGQGEGHRGADRVRGEL